MIISKKRLLKLPARLTNRPGGSLLRVGVIIQDELKPKLLQAGFVEPFAIGSTLLPSADLGPTCHFNAEGKYLIHRDQPMETAYRQTEWHWTQWSGRYDSEIRSKIVDVPYQRYPRTFISPPSVEFTCAENAQNQPTIVSRAFAPSEGALLLHTINVGLECFGHCQVFSQKLVALARTISLNWTILPPGKQPWETLRPHLAEILTSRGKATAPVIENRLETINGYGPDFVAKGHAGFSGYLVFGFLAQDIFILESSHPDNATYVLNANWEKISRLTKAQILSNSLHQDRFVHRIGWKRKLATLLHRPAA